jgi:hypothetical protein
VRLVYNEQVIPATGCGAQQHFNHRSSTDDASIHNNASGHVDCDLDEFIALLQDKADPMSLDRVCTLRYVKDTNSSHMMLGILDKTA